MDNIYRQFRSRCKIVQVQDNIYFPFALNLAIQSNVKMDADGRTVAAPFVMYVHWDPEVHRNAIKLVREDWDEIRDGELIPTIGEIKLVNNIPTYIPVD